MNGVEFINRETNFNHSQYVRKNKGSITNIPKSLMELLYNFSAKTKELGEGTFKSNEITPVLNKVITEKKAKVRVLKKEEASGFALVGSLTLIGTIIMSIIIFTIIGKIIM